MITARVNRWIVLVVVLLAHGAALANALPAVRTMRVPDGGIQPQVVARGDVVHLLYFTGEPKAGDVQYARSADGGRTFGKAIRVNSEPGSAIAIGTIRGPRLAIGKGGRAHVAWMGSQRATARAPGNEVPMLYAHLNDTGDAFEAQRNLIAKHPGLDGGGTVVADDAGNVSVIWHAPAKPGSHDEAGRCVWAARSTDEGKTFAPERRVNDANTGVCACCGLVAFADEGGGLSVLYRGATERVHRDMHLVRLDAHMNPAGATVLDRLNVGVCVMSTAAILRTPKSFLAAWEGQGEVFYGPIDGARPLAAPTAPAGDGKNRKHPRLAVNEAGQMLLVWTEETGWNRGGSVAWQVLDEQLKPIGRAGRAEGLPVWGTAAAFPTPDGFTVVY
jgi:hypothetical protein